MFDCIIVGAGPAGGSAAYHLAKRGRSVLVLDRDALPRYKACSGGVSPAISQWFEFDFSPVIEEKVTQIRYTWKVGDPVEASLDTPEPMWMVQRDKFDHYLIQQAQQVGAEVRDQTAVQGIEFKGDHWQVNTVNGPVAAKYLIAADGAKGPMAQWLGFSAHQSRMGAVMEIPTTTGPQAQFDFGLIKNGFIWSLPKGDRYSIGTGTFRGGEENLSKALTEYAKKRGFDASQAQIHEHPMSMWDGDSQLHGRNALLAGEAAGLSDPFTAEGIRPAIFSGMKAAESIDAALSGDVNALSGYSATLQAEWGKDMAWAQKLSKIFYRAPGLGYKVGVKRPSATSKLLKIMCGELRYADVAGYALKKLSGGLIRG
ncbi:geranylgeranyl reductase family protein [filamentous cyanobacterium LEGE 11480]|uniref:Geranylgeranyl reductase family protein n=1 Tax=Romeriopsis navalis LEGE 11480 TaxID=2777977 RepID=A0A928VSK6_9CYAN|nr:geranylgeranyl reductase family protein [Romeriopsis navalis LEGE 11480]